MWAKWLDRVGDLPEWVGIRPPSLHVKSCSGFELWSLNDSAVSEFRVAWRKALRRVINIP